MVHRPGIAWAVAGGAYLLLVLWGPTHALRTWWGILILAALLAVGIAVLRREIVREFPDAGDDGTGPPPAPARSPSRPETPNVDLGRPEPPRSTLTSRGMVNVDVDRRGATSSTSRRRRLLHAEVVLDQDERRGRVVRDLLDHVPLVRVGQQVHRWGTAGRVRRRPDPASAPIRVTDPPGDVPGSRPHRVRRRRRGPARTVSVTARRWAWTRAGRAARGRSRRAGRRRGRLRPDLAQGHEERRGGADRTEAQAPDRPRGRQQRDQEQGEGGEQPRVVDLRPVRHPLAAQEQLGRHRSRSATASRTRSRTST